MLFSLFCSDIHRERERRRNRNYFCLLDKLHGQNCKLLLISSRTPYLGCPLSGVVYFVTIIFFTLLTWVTVARIYFTITRILNYRLTLRHTFHFYDIFSFGRLYIRLKTVHKKIILWYNFLRHHDKSRILSH